MSRFEGMSDEEIQAWAEEQRQRSQEQFQDQPVGPISRVKQGDMADVEPHTWAFHLEAGARAELNRRTEISEATVVGLREVADGGPLALVVREGDRLVALRRLFGDTWGGDVTATTVPVDAWWPWVEEWPVPDAATAGGRVAAPPAERPELQVRTNRFPDQP